MDEEVEDSVRQEYFELLRYESVGADPAKFADTVKCASWWKKWLGKLGFSAELLYPEEVHGAGCLVPSASKDAPSARHQAPSASLPPPVVFAERKVSEHAPTILVYGHYDVQPADPFEEWKTPPFEPTVVGDRVYCRGAQDDKGQTFAFLCGVRDLLEGKREENGSPQPSTFNPQLNIKVLLEGQEESGSTSLSELLKPNVYAKDAEYELRQRVAADVLLVCDTGAAGDLRPAIVAGLRGVSHFTVRLTAANRDLHSGEYGGIAPNPAQGMAELMASLHNPDGSIAVAGFRDGIEPPTHDELRLAEASSPVETDYEADIGCEPVGGQLGKTLVQRNSFEPTIELNGIHSGYGGPGAKTVIPREAMAKLSMRLVPGQSPRRAFDCVRKHLEEHEPRGMKVIVEDWNPGAGGFRLPLASPLFRLAEDVLTQMDARGPVFQWDGASIPVVSAVREASGAAPLIVGWGQSEDRIHSPNESYSFRQFALAREWGRKIVAELAK